MAGIARTCPWAPVELHIGVLALVIDEREGVDAIPLHVPVVGCNALHACQPSHLQYAHTPHHPDVTCSSAVALSYHIAGVSALRTRDCCSVEPFDGIRQQHGHPELACILLHIGADSMCSERTLLGYGAER